MARVVSVQAVPGMVVLQTPNWRLFGIISRTPRSRECGKRRGSYDHRPFAYPRLSSSEHLVDLLDQSSAASHSLICEFTHIFQFLSTSRIPFVSLDKDGRHSCACLSLLHVHSNHFWLCLLPAFLTSFTLSWARLASPFSHAFLFTRRAQRFTLLLF